MERTANGIDTDLAIRGPLLELLESVWANRHLGSLGTTAGALVFAGLNHDAAPATGAGGRTRVVEGRRGIPDVRSGSPRSSGR